MWSIHKVFGMNIDQLRVFPEDGYQLIFLKFSGSGQ